ncbi:MAG: hypothetical protein JST16_16040 [Bdellovibrionales bacterium]|nr:hypothetical protein [Bdellovibrionales bacterium]
MACLRTLGLLALVFGTSLRAHASPQIIRVDGAVYDSAGLPVTGTHSMVVKAYDAASGGTLLWTSNTYGSVVLGAGGKFTVNLDATTGSPNLVQQMAASASSGGVYFEISYDTNTVKPRIRAKGTVFALSAGSLHGVTVSAAEMNYLTGVTANLQSQINAAGGAAGKVSKTGDSMSGGLQVGAAITSTGVVTGSGLNSTGATASRFAMFDGSKNVVSSASATTDVEFGYLSGVTASVQSQLSTISATAAGVSAKVSKTGDSMSGALQVGAAITSTGTVTAATLNATGLTANRVIATDASKNLVISSVTDTELAYLSGATANVQTQINGLAGSVASATYQTTSGSCYTGYTAVDTQTQYICIQGSSAYTGNSYVTTQACPTAPTSAVGSAPTSNFWSAQLNTATIRTCRTTTASSCYTTTTGSCDSGFTNVDTITVYSCMVGSSQFSDVHPVESYIACPTAATTTAGSPPTSGFWSNQLNASNVKVCCK